MKRFFANISDRQYGFTLIELLLVLALIGIVLAIGYQAFAFTNTSWQMNEALNPRISEANTLMSVLGKEIRGAEKPSDSAAAVTVPAAEGSYAAGQRLYLYRYDASSSQWTKIFYRVYNNTLQRSVFSDASAVNVINASFPTANWETKMNGISAQQVFADSSSGTGDQRLIEIVLNIADTEHPSNPRFQPFTISSSYLSRSRDVGSLSGSPVAGPGGETSVSVFSVTLNTTSRSLDKNKNFTLTARVHPSNASNKSVSWSSSDPSVATVSGSGLSATVTGVAKGTAVITVTTADGGKTAYCRVDVAGGSGGC